LLNTLLAQFTSIGGPVLALLLLLSVVATATAIAKLVVLSRLGVGRRRIVRQVLSRWAAGDAAGAQKLAGTDKSALGRVVASTIAARLRWPGDQERAREIATGAGLVLLDRMSAQVRVLETAVQAAPMLGLLGTVLGMIAAFNEMATTGGAISPIELAGGIWVALSATALGLSIAIPFYFLTTWIEGRIERERAAMDAAILALVYGAGPEIAETQLAPAAPPPPAAETLPFKRH
jgi:biopolymer transport protein ExbB